MIADVAAIVRDIAPGLLRDGPASVVAVRTTYPKYLVFDDDAARPACVVEFGDRVRLARRHHIVEQLHFHLPDAIPRSVCCTQWTEEAYVHVISGLHGLPWFRVADGLATAADWRSVLDRSISSMRSFHQTVGTFAKWRSDVSVSCALSEQLRRLMAEGPRVPREIVSAVAAAIATASSAPVPSVWQHGDFSLNNLMITPHGAAIIDFDDFGRTSVPLHDAFGLAFSFPLSQQGRCLIPPSECLATCIDAAIELTPVSESSIRPLLLHHLLWRINECTRHPTRHRLQQRLLEVLESAVTCGDDWAEGVDRVLMRVQ